MNKGLISTPFRFHQSFEVIQPILFHEVAKLTGIEEITATHSTMLKPNMGLVQIHHSDHLGGALGQDMRSFLFCFLPSETSPVSNTPAPSSFFRVSSSNSSNKFPYNLSNGLLLPSPDSLPPSLIHISDISYPLSDTIGQSVNSNILTRENYIRQLAI